MSTESIYKIRSMLIQIISFLLLQLNLLNLLSTNPMMFVTTSREITRLMLIACLNSVSHATLNVRLVKVQNLRTAIDAKLTISRELIQTTITLDVSLSVQ